MWESFIIRLVVNTPYIELRFRLNAAFSIILSVVDFKTAYVFFDLIAKSVQQSHVTYYNIITGQNFGYHNKLQVIVLTHFRPYTQVTLGSKKIQSCCDLCSDSLLAEPWNCKFGTQAH